MGTMAFGPGKTGSVLISTQCGSTDPTARGVPLPSTPVSKSPGMPAALFASPTRSPDAPDGPHATAESETAKTAPQSDRANAFLCPMILQLLLLGLLEDLELHAAVLLAAFVGAVVGDRSVLPVALRDQPLRFDGALLERL